MKTDLNKLDLIKKIAIPGCSLLARVSYGDYGYIINGSVSETTFKAEVKKVIKNRLLEYAEIRDPNQRYKMDDVAYIFLEGSHGWDANKKSIIRSVKSSCLVIIFSDFDHIESLSKIESDWLKKVIFISK